MIHFNLVSYNYAMYKFSVYFTYLYIVISGFVVNCFNLAVETESIELQVDALVRKNPGSSFSSGPLAVSLKELLSFC